MTVVDEAQDHRFTYVDDAGTAELEYELDGDRLVLLHTRVPKAMGGQGIAGRLVEAAVERARANGETIVPSCSYARGWLAKHPDEADTVRVDLTGLPN